MPTGILRITREAAITVDCPSDNRAAGKRARMKQAYLVPATPTEAPIKGEARRALRRLSLREYLRRNQHGEVWPVNLEWMKKPPVPIAEMSLRQRKAELGRQLKRLSGHRSVRDRRGHFFTEPASYLFDAINTGIPND